MIEAQHVQSTKINLVDRLKTDKVFEDIMQNTFNLQEFVLEFQTKCKNKAVDLVHVLWKAVNPADLVNA